MDHMISTPNFQRLISLKEIQMFEIEPDTIVVSQNSNTKSIFYVVDGFLIAEAGFLTMFRFESSVKILTEKL